MNARCVWTFTHLHRWLSKYCERYMPQLVYCKPMTYVSIIISWTICLLHLVHFYVSKFEAFHFFRIFSCVHAFLSSICKIWFHECSWYIQQMSHCLFQLLQWDSFELRTIFSSPLCSQHAIKISQIEYLH